MVQKLPSDKKIILLVRISLLNFMDFFKVYMHHSIVPLDDVPKTLVEHNVLGSIYMPGHDRLAKSFIDAL